MNELQIEAMERKLQEMQEQLKAMKEARSGGSLPAMLPASEIDWDCSKGHIYFGTLSVVDMFPSQEIAEAYGDAFRVMLELRRCEGAGHYYEESGYRYAYSLSPSYNWIVLLDAEYVENFSIVPPFPTEALAQAAIDNVGKERIIAAMRLLANVKGE